MGQIVEALKQAEVGVPVVVVIREAGISKQAFYQWKAKYIGLEAARFGATTNPLVETLRLILMTGTLSARWKRRLWAFGQQVVEWAIHVSSGWPRNRLS